MEYEKAVTPQVIAEMFGFSYQQIQAFCRRKEHPCPNINVSETSDYFRIRPSKFAQWLDEEEERKSR